MIKENAIFHMNSCIKCYFLEFLEEYENDLKTVGCMQLQEKNLTNYCSRLKTALWVIFLLHMFKRRLKASTMKSGIEYMVYPIRLVSKKTVQME
jgi:hypothetical protein